MNFFTRKSDISKIEQQPVLEPLAQALEPRIMFDGAALATAAEAVTDTDTDSNQVVVVDTSVKDYQKLLDAVAPEADLIMIQGDQDGFEALANELSSRENIDALHIISHGSEGMLSLGNAILNAGNLLEYSDELGVIGDALSEMGDVLIYGCDIAGNAQGVSFVESLALAIGADVAASDDLTGSAALGGDWDLEIVKGTIEADRPFSDKALADYSDVLAYTGTINFNTGGNFTSSGGTSGAGDDVAYTVGSYSLQFNGTSNSVRSYNNYVQGAYQGNESSIVMNFAGGQTFDPQSVSFAQYSGGTVTIKVTANTGASLTQSFNDSSLGSINLTSLGTGLTSLTFSNNAGGTLSFVKFDDLAVNNVADAVVAPTITSATYDSSTGNLVVTGTGFTATAGATNDVVANKFTITGEGASTYTLTDTANVEITSATAFTLTLSATDQTAVEQILNKDGTASTGGTTYDVDGAAGFIAASASDADTGANGITVSNTPAPTITSATYDYNSNTVTVTGTGFVKNSGATNDVDLSKLTFTGEGGSTYTITTATDVEITNGTTFSFTLTGDDITGVESLLNNDGTTSATAGTTYNLAGAAGFMRGDSTSAADASAGVTVSNYAVPTVTSATFDYATGALVVTGTNFVKSAGATNDVDVSLLAFTGEGGVQYQLTSASNVEITSATSYTVTLSGADLTSVKGLLNQNGTTSATAGTTFSLASIDNWMTGSPAANNVADAAATITVSNYAAPAITSAAYNYSTNQLVVTGTNFVSQSGATNDVDISLLTLTGEGGTTYTITSTSNVEIDSATQFTITLSGSDLVNVESILNNDGTTSATAGTTYNLAAADNWMTQAPAATDIADATGNAITVSNYANPAVTSSTYNWSTGVFTFTGTNLVAASGASNDITANLLTVTGEGGSTYTLTDTSNVDITSSTAFTVTLSATDRLAVNGLLNKDGTTSATAATTYNVAFADNWAAGAPAGNNIADTTSTVTVSNYATPTITSATYDYNTNVLVVTGTNFVSASGANNDIDISLLTFTGEGGSTYTITSATNVDITSATQFSVTLSGADIPGVESLLNNDGTTSATAGTTYNLAAADNWLTQAPSGSDIADTTSNAVTVSNYAAPAVTSATYDWSNGQLVVTGTNFVKSAGATNDITANLLTFTGDGGATYTLTDTSNVEITSATEFTVTLSATDQLNVRGLLNKDGTTAGSGTTYNIAFADNWAAGAPAATDIADATGNAITVSNVSAPTVTSATYDSDTGILVVTGTNFFKENGATNDVDISLLTLTGGAGNATYTITSASNVEITSATQFSVTLSGADKTNVDALLDQVGTSSSGGSTYNIAAADNWLVAADSATDIADATNAVTVSINPKITSANYNATTGVIVVTGTNIQALAGATNDITANKFTVTGEGGATYTLTDTANVERTSATAFTLTLSATDKAGVNLLLNKAGTTSTGGTTFNLAAADDWNANVTAGDTADTTGNGITVSNVPVPTVTSATYDASTGALVITGTDMTKLSGATNEVIANLFTLTGEGGETYTLTDTANVEITSGTAATLTLSATDRAALNLIFNKNGTSSTGSTTYNIAAADNWAAGADSAVNTADLTGNAVTVSNVANPTITSATYDYSTGALVLTGTNLTKFSGATNDIDASMLTLTGEGGATYTLTDTADVEITSGTAATLTLSATDRLAVNGLLNKDGTTSATAGTTFNVAAADNWARGADAASNIADATAGVTVSNYAAPTITSATYDYNTNVLVVTGTNFVSKSGATNDIDISMLTLTGEGGATYTITSATDVEVTSATQFSVTLSGADIPGVESLLNNDGTTSATAGTTYNIAAADNWLAQAPAGTDIADTTSNGVTVSNYAAPAVTSATYDWSNGQLVVTGTNFVQQAGATNDITANLLTFTGDGGATYTLTDTSNVEITSATAFTVTLSATDQLNVKGLLNKDGTTAGSGTTYNIAFADNWAAGAPAATDIADATGNAVTVSNVSAPAITSATYDSDTGVMVVTGTNFFKENGATNDVDISLLTLTGGAGNATYTITSASNVEITSATSFSVTLSGADKTNVDALLDQLGTSSSGGSTYNLAAADNWLVGADSATDIADATNAVTVSINPKITSANYNATTGALVVTGTNIQALAGATNDITANKFTLTGEGGVTYTLTDTANVERTSATAFTLTLSATDKAAVNLLLNKAGTASTGGTTFNLAAADDWNANVTAGDTADATGNGITVSNVPVPTITSATYDASNGALVITGTNMTKLSGAANEVIANLLTFTGEGGETYTLSDTSNVEITSATAATLTLSATDRAALNLIFNKNGTNSTGTTTYNIAGAEDWAAGADSAVNVADLTGNAVTVSNVANPTITSTTYNTGTGVLVLTGTNLTKFNGATNDIDASLLTITGEGGATYTLTDTSDVEITSGTRASLTLSATDKAQVDALLNAAGTASADSTTYNVAFADNWARGADAAANIADATGNGVTVTVPAAATTPEPVAPKAPPTAPPEAPDTSSNVLVDSDRGKGQGISDAGLEGDKTLLGDNAGLALGKEQKTASVESVTSGQVMSAKDGGGFTSDDVGDDPSAGVAAMTIVRNAVTGNDGQLNSSYGSSLRTSTGNSGGATNTGGSQPPPATGSDNVGSLAGTNVMSTVKGLGGNGGALGNSGLNGGNFQFGGDVASLGEQPASKTIQLAQATTSDLNDLENALDYEGMQLTSFTKQVAQQGTNYQTDQLEKALKMLG
ncbi:DUF4347 domain-containing protein [Terasakiella sp. A23]|uniref:DUF4347 domain-containing protein n=1 Tax=Terasakiella sp. FCG-A23 TaxID=3080561 RepID=UPI0029553139|nr:DUF4347 domain-containing protein [Terasakiella sp. A23]MDV7340346.1 DUF4347 domain-containing protein [Terasakiella sp. A23]